MTSKIGKNDVDKSIVTTDGGDWPSVGVQADGAAHKSTLESSPDANGSTTIWNFDDSENTGNRRGLRIFNDTSGSPVNSALYFLDVEEGKTDSYQIFGQHNKPASTYMGNGNAAPRYIYTGGVGDILCIFNTGRFGFVTNTGALIFSDGKWTWYDASVANFTNGALYIASTSNDLNCNGWEYSYRVL